MAPRIPLSAVNKTPALFFSPAKASSRLLPPLVRTSQQARTAAACATDPVLEAMMGRAGYDTTNMKVAKNPRPAAAAKKNDDPKTGAQKTQDDSNNKNNKGDAEKKPREQTPSYDSSPFQPIIPIIPMECEYDPPPREPMHIPRINGSTVTFWL